MVRGRGLHLQSFVAQLLQLTANCHRNEKKQPRPFRHKDFMPKSRRRKRLERKAEAAALERFLNSLPEK